MSNDQHGSHVTKKGQIRLMTLDIATKTSLNMTFSVIKSNYLAQY
jgi:hypothetical protein